MQDINLHCLLCAGGEPGIPRKGEIIERAARRVRFGLYCLRVRRSLRKDTWGAGSTATLLISFRLEQLRPIRSGFLLRLV